MAFAMTPAQASTRMGAHSKIDRFQFLFLLLEQSLSSNSSEFPLSTRDAFGCEPTAYRTFFEKI